SIMDAALPFDALKLQTILERIGIPNAGTVAERSDAAQWSYCPVKFDLRVGRNYSRNQIIPICRKRPINQKGGTASLWLIEVQEEFVGDLLKDAVPASRFHNPDDGLGFVSYPSTQLSCGISVHAGKLTDCE